MLSGRVLEAELMDQPGLDVSVHLQALHGLRRVNAWSRTAGIIWSEIRVMVRRHRLTAVRAAFQEQEVRSLARRAGLSQITIRRHWPQRFLLIWNRP